ncbi:phytanoyl-CoA dioxygenase family protein [Kumtagia ephedrae]|uniref:phytanoyl-CoA dioxygenase family protein n=1 Tax=Kumtagia ephedrae TaxID=2116701 RepID=UPI001A9C493E|nr:phytanoyl-CoA dioxygenase family protein [Mesorhizobium ephedrae]
MNLRGPLGYLLFPLSALRLVSGYKSFADPLIGDAGLNRRGLHVWRMRLAHRIADMRRGRLARLVPEVDRAFFAEHGFVEKRNLLQETDYAALVEEIRVLTAPARDMIEGNAVTRRIAVTPAVLARAPHLRLLLESAEWRGLTRYIGGFNAEPIVCIQTIFALSGGSRSDPQTKLHMDTFHPTMKAWFFLHGVEPDQGPFTYVPGSHRPTKRRQAWHKRRSVLASRKVTKGGAFRVADEQLPILRLPGRHTFAVPGNTLVVADTFGLHARGLSLRPSTRVEIYASMRPNPFNPLTFLDTALLPFVHGRKLQIGWWMEDLLVSLGLTRRIWKKVGRVSPWQRSGA